MQADIPLTTRQQEIWQFLVSYVDDHGYPPTVREIGEKVGLASPSTVHAHLANLERVGLIKFGSRVDVFFGPEWDLTVQPGMRVSAGSSILARRNTIGEAGR